MNENKELLVLINENTKMGLASTKELLKLIMIIMEDLLFLWI